MAIAPRAVTINRKADPRGACGEKKYEPCRTFPVSSPTQRQCNGKSQDSRAASVPIQNNSTTRHRAKSTAGTGRIGHGSATHQTANLCSKLNCASLPRPQGRAGALNLEDDSGRHEDLGTTERPHPSDGSYPREITERIPEFQVGPSEASISSVVFLFSVFFSP